MDIIKAIRSQYKVIKKGDFFLINFERSIDKALLAIIDSRGNRNANKLADIKLLVKSVTESPSIVGGIVIVDSIGSLMNRIQSKVIYVRSADALNVIELAVKSLNWRGAKQMGVPSLRKVFGSFVLRDEIKVFMHYEESSQHYVKPRQKNYSDKSLGEAADVIRFSKADDIIREQRDFEGHQKWNLD